jgi:hypothetical protein
VNDCRIFFVPHHPIPIPFYLFILQLPTYSSALELMGINMMFPFAQSQEKLLSQILIRSAHSKEFFQIDLLIREEAGSDLTVRGEPKAIAMVAEVAADRTDESNFSDCTFYPEPLRRSIPPIRGDRNEFCEPLQTVLD